MTESDVAYASRKGRIFEEACRPRLRELFKDDPRPPIFHPHITRNHQLLALGFSSLHSKQVAVREGITRLGGPIGTGFDGIRYPPHPVKHMLIEVKLNPNPNIEGQLKVTAEALRITGRRPVYVFVIPEGTTLAATVMKHLCVAEVYTMPVPDVARQEAPRRALRPPFVPRDYQVEASKAILAAIARGERIIQVNLPVNLGKSYLIALTMRSTPPSLMVEHQVATTPLIRLSDELCDKIEHVMQRPANKFNMLQSKTKTVKEAIDSLAVTSASLAWGESMPIMVTTNTSFAQLANEFLKGRDAKGVVYVDEAHKWSFTHFAEDFATMTNLTWVFLSGTLPTKLPADAAALLEAHPPVYTFPYLEALRRGFNLPLHFHLFQPTVAHPFGVSVAHWLVSRNKKKVVVFSPNDTKAHDIEGHLGAIFSQYNLKHRIHHITHTNSNRGVELELFASDNSTTLDIEVMSAVYIGRFGLDNALVDAIVCNFHEATATKIDDADIVNQIGARVRVSGGRTFADVATPSSLFGHVAGYVQKYDPSFEYTRLTYESPHPYEIFARDDFDSAQTQARDVRRFRYEWRALLHRSADGKTKIHDQSEFESCVKALLEAYPTNGPHSDDTVDVTFDHPALGAVAHPIKASLIKTHLKHACRDEGFHVSGELRAAVEECAWVRAFVACNRKRAMSNTTCPRWTEEYAAGLQSLPEEPLRSADVAFFADKLMVTDSASTKVVAKFLAMILHNRGNVVIKRTDGTNETVAIPGLQHPRLNHDMYPILAAIKHACKPSQGGDRGNGGLSQAMGKLIIYQHYRMNHSLYQELFAERVANKSQKTNAAGDHGERQGLLNFTPATEPPSSAEETAELASAEWLSAQKAHAAEQLRLLQAASATGASREENVAPIANEAALDAGPVAARDDGA